MTIFIDHRSRVPLYLQIVEQVRAAVASGRIAEGEFLPFARDLAADLALNVNTVAKAYTELARTGIVWSYPGRGKFVAPRRQVYTRSERRRRTQHPLNAFLSEALLMGFTPRDIHGLVTDGLEELSRKPKR